MQKKERPTQDSRDSEVGEDVVSAKQVGVLRTPVNETTFGREEK